MITEIVKRNGTKVPFDQNKIIIVMQKAFAAENISVDEATLQQMADRVTASLVTICDGRENCPNVEQVQDLVENTLMERGYFNVAKAYILYRYKHTEERKEEVAKQADESGLIVKTRTGTEEIFDVEKIRAELTKAAEGYEDAVNVEELVNQLKYELYEGITTKEIQKALILVVRSRIETDPAYSKMASRLLIKKVYREVLGRYVEDEAERARLHNEAFERHVKAAVEKGTFDPQMAQFDFKKIGKMFRLQNDDLFEYMGLEILSSRYCMETKEDGLLETPQMVWMRVAMGLALAEVPEKRHEQTQAFYEVLSNFYYTPGGRTLFQAGFKKAQLSNCFINVVPDSLDGIFKSYADNAQYLKWSGGTGTSWTPVRAIGAYIKGTGVGSQGIVPFLKIANDVNGAINRSGKRRGAGCVYLETWHLDIEDFLELRKNTGDERRRTHDINTANWIPDLFMKRVREDGDWTLFSPDEVPDLHDKYGKAFEEAYTKYEEMAERGEMQLTKRIKAKDLWKKMLGMLYETGHPWITFKDPSNIRSPQDHVGVVHSSNLCTEITLNTSEEETAVCNIGSLNFARFVQGGTFDNELVGSVTRTAIRMLDNVIDLNYYPTEVSRRSNLRHRPVGLGVRGYHDALYRLGIEFDTPEAVQFADESMEVVAYYAILASSELARERGAYESYEGSKWDRGLLPQDTIALLAEERGEAIDVTMGEKLDWTPVREHVRQYGMRNSNTMAIAPTASTANLVGCIPCVEPIYKNIYVKSNKEGEFTVINKYLVEDLKARNLWNEEMLNRLKYSGGSVQDIEEIPLELKRKYKEAFEVDAKWLIDAAAQRGKWIDQSQSINIFYRGSSGKEISDTYFYAWKKGLKTTYYLRTLGASQVEKSTVGTAGTHLRQNKKQEEPEVEGAPMPTPLSQAEEVPAGAHAEGIPSPLLTPSPMTREKIESSKVRVEPKKQFNLHVAEDATCESCQG